MRTEPPGSFSARLYGLLLYLYPPSFRREYGEAMLQLFNDQHRAARGAGGYATLWLKTLRDVVRSVPAAHSSRRDGAARYSKGAVFVWTIVAILGFAFLLNALVLPAWISRTPSADEAAVVASSALGPTGEYRTLARVAVAFVSTLLAAAAFLFALRQRRVLNGAAAFVAGAGLTFFALAVNPWIWLPLDEYPVAIGWALGIWPFAALGWIALTLAARARQRPHGA